MGNLGLLGLKSVSANRNSNHERSSKRTYIGAFTTDCDENYVSSNLILEVDGNPYGPVGITYPHPSDGQQFIQNIDVSLLVEQKSTFTDDSQGQHYNSLNGTGCLYWRVDIDWGPFNPLEQSASGNMVDMPTRIQWEFDEEEMPLWQDYSVVDQNGYPIGKPIVNAANDYFNPGISRLYSNARLIVMRNEANPDWGTIGGNYYFTNASTWNGFPPRTVLIKPVRSPSAKYSQVLNGYYYEMQYNFYLRTMTWDAFVLNQGFNKIGVDSSGNPARVPILVNGVVTTEQVPLDANGQPLAEPINNGQLVILQFQKYPTTDFGFLNMDNVLQTGQNA